MKDDVMQAVEKLPIEPSQAQGHQRMKEMTKARGEQFFAYLLAHLEAHVDRDAAARAN
jgi:hypothetical protein